MTRRIAAILVPFLLVPLLFITPATAMGDEDVAASPAGITYKRPKVAVVLGGGAARGFSHIGLLQALEEYGIPIDMLVGTSMGSIVAGLYASGLSTDNLTYLVTQVDMNRFFTPTLPPKGGVVRTDAFEEFLDLLTHEVRLEQMPIPFYSVITNVVTGEEVALSEGPFGRAIVASMAIPGMFAPVEIDGQYFVDGGLLSPVPGNVAQAQAADFIIAVDVRRTVSDIDHDSIFNNLQLALYFLLDKNTNEQLQAADVIVAPRLADNSYMEYDQAAFFIAEGYRAAVEVMDGIRAGLLELDPEFPFGARAPQAGIDRHTFAELVQNTVATVDDRARAHMTVHPAVQIATNRRPDFTVDLHVPLGATSGPWPLFADYSLNGGASRWTHTVGLGTGDCTELCLGLFARSRVDGGGWNTGLKAAGMLNRLVWSAKWEHAPPAAASPWRVDLQVPSPDAVTTVGSEWLFHIRRDPRGLSGRPSEAVRATGLYRHYFLGPQRNVWELLRGGAHWYIGVGLTAATANDATGLSSTKLFPVDLHPVGEAGLLFEGRLFGLYAIRSRVSLTYDGGDDAWTLRLSFGD